MKNSKPCVGVAAMCALAYSSAPAIAHDGEAQDSSVQESVIYKADSHAPAGVMADHMHKKGEIMIGLRLMREVYRAPNQQGSADITPLEIANQGFSSATQKMTMDMAMLDIMYAPTDNVTLMLMPQYMKMDMTMVGLPMTAANMSSSHSGHTMIEGDIHSHSTEGFGDTKVAALYKLVSKPGLNIHAAMGLSIPTGKVTRKNADGSFVHYGMQSGSGTWDIEPSITISGGNGPMRFGAQTGYVWRTSKTNKSGFSFGDTFNATAWSSYRFAPEMSGSLRGIYSYQGAVNGHYTGSHNHMSPADRQANYGGHRVAIGIGFNIVPNSGAMKGLRIGSEIEIPLYQDVNGIQAPKTVGLNISLSKAF